MNAGPTWPLACPVCRSVLDDQARCAACAVTYRSSEGIWRFLPPERFDQLTPFLRDYTRIRLAEGRGSDDPDYYRKLPGCHSSHPLAGQWRIRERTFECFIRRILPSLGDRLKILDLGAGVGWLSHQLAARGHYPCAIDLSVDNRDGLAAARHYGPDWPRMQAEFDHLPLIDASVDVAIYNASLHYSTDYLVTLSEALRVLRPDGRILVLDSPIYKNDESGRRMVAEKHSAFERQYGTRSDAIPSMEYLTWGILEQLASDLRLAWRIVTPRYGFRWAMRPLIARLKNQREPSRFSILVGQRNTR